MPGSTVTTTPSLKGRSDFPGLKDVGAGRSISEEFWQNSVSTTYTPKAEMGISPLFFGQKHIDGNSMKLLILLIFLLCLAISTQVIADSMVAHYRFDGNANDDSPSNNHGTVHDASLTTDRFGNENSAYHFNGTTSYIDIGNDPSLKMDAEVTIATWINIDFPLTGGTGFYNVISDHSRANNNGKIFRFQNSALEFLLGPEGSLEAHYAFPDSASGWHHIAVTYDGDSIIIYVDSVVSVASAQRQGTIVVNKETLLIGKSGWGEFFKGDMDDFRIYNRALRPEEIFDLVFKDSFED